MLLTTEARRSLFQYGAETAKGVTTMARAPSARALATERLSRAGGGEGLAVGAAALGAGGLVPVADGEGVLGFGGGFGIAREEAREEAVAFGGEGVDSEAPAQAVSELEGLFAE